MEKKEYKYRVIRSTYHDKTVPEDGSGSLTNVVSDKKERVTWQDTLDKQITVKDIPAVTTYPGDNFTCTLQLYNSGKDEWEFVGHVDHKYVNAEGEEEDDDVR